MIDSINFLLGARSSRDILRSGEERALVSALFFGFSPADAAEFAKHEIEPDEDGNLLISRTMNAEGRTRAGLTGGLLIPILFGKSRQAPFNIHGQNDAFNC